MNKSALKRFATEARVELLEKVELQARKLGITAESIKKANVESSDAVFIDGKQLTETERKQRNKLITRINEIGFSRVMEETAYTWFNRFIALRYMEVNDYLPTKVRVLSSHSGSAEPDMMKEALSLDLEIDKEYIYDLKMNNETDELFKYLIKMHCNDLNRYMPFMFETIEDYTEILFPEGLLGTDSFVRQMTNIEVITEGNWEKIEVIGWLYQYYIADEKDRVFKAKKKYKAEEIPFATQLFTPDWIVQYMVQNSLGRYWTEAHPEHQDLIVGWQYYLENQQEDFQEKIVPYINKELNVEDIKCFDPAMGSGHILVYMFDVLYEIYSKCGYMEREIPRLIIENNLYGLDIDDRAYQLASFSVVMKALEYNRRFLRSVERDGLILNLASFQETNNITVDDVAFMAGEDSGASFDYILNFVEQFRDAKTIGSLIKMTSKDTIFIQQSFNVIDSMPITDLFETEKRDRALVLLPKLIKQADVMTQQYDILVTNPPYMGSGSMNESLYNYLGKNYKDSKLDVFASFMELNHFLKKNAYYACVNQHSWMFLESFESLRKKIIKNMFIQSMLHLGPRAFEGISGEVVQSTTFVMRNIPPIDGEIGLYLNLVNERTADEKRIKILEVAKKTASPIYYKYSQIHSLQIPGNPLAYWLNDKYFKLFKDNKSIDNYVESKAGVVTGNDPYFIKFWHEVDFREIDMDGLESGHEFSKYHLMSKGGSHRRFYGNNEFIIKLKELWDPSKTNKSVRRGDRNYYFRKAIGWSYVGNKQKSFRIVVNSICGTATPTIYLTSDDSYFYFLAFLNSKVAYSLLNIFNQTMNLLSSDICSLPMIIDGNYHETVSELTLESINISKIDWDLFEGSWDFQTHPLLLQKKDSNHILNAFSDWENISIENFNTLKKNEEELNRIFIDIYGLQDELTPEVEDADISIRKADLERDIKSFISYAIGCSFGRYSLGEEGLIYAGGEFNASRYQTFPADENNILPILSGAYFEDDIVTKFIDFVRITFSEETLEENLDLVADATGRRKNETAREALRRYFLNDFYKDHVQVYKKRPIYWLFTSGREKAFNCLIYMHRYDKSTLSRIRTDYLHEVQTRLDAEKSDLLEIINGESTTREVSQARKELNSLDKKIDELKAYDELLHHMADRQIEINLDDGVKANYEMFEGLVARI